MKKKSFIGVKFYRANEDSYDVYRVIKKKGDSTFIVLDDTNERKELKQDWLLKECRAIMPHAYIAFVVCENGTGNTISTDLITLIGRHGEDKEYAVCRQNIFDPYTELVYQGRKHKMGAAISREACPNNVNYEAVKTHSKFIKSYNLATYLDDTPKSILEIAEAAKRTGDKVLTKNQEKYGKYAEGFCSSIEDLWEENSFWQLYDEMNRVNKIPGTIKDNILSIAQLYYLEEQIEHQILNWSIVPYYYDIDLDAINMNYSLLRDETKKVYVIIFQKGNKVENTSLDLEELRKFYAVKR